MRSICIAIGALFVILFAIAIVEDCDAQLAEIERAALCKTRC